MKWMLIAIVFSSPVKTDLKYETLDQCLRAEQAMRAQWANTYNDALGHGATKDTLDMMQKQMSFGTCIPAK